MKLDKRRRQEYKTNFHKRLILLKARAPRLVIRKSNKYILLQIVESKNAQDKVVYSVSTKDLLEYGWPEEKQGSLKSIPAAYLGGYLIGKKAKGLKERVILDTGLISSTKGSRVYAAVKGVSDSGLEIKYDEKIIPLKDRIEGKNTELNLIFNKVKGGIK